MPLWRACNVVEVLLFEAAPTTSLRAEVTEALHQDGAEVIAEYFGGSAPESVPTAADEAGLAGMLSLAQGAK